jgi:hypothetical protein
VYEGQRLWRHRARAPRHPAKHRGKREEEQEQERIVALRGFQGEWKCVGGEGRAYGFVCQCERMTAGTLPQCYK